MQEAFGPPNHQSVQTLADTPTEVPDHAVSPEAELSGNAGNSKSKNNKRKKKKKPAAAKVVEAAPSPNVLKISRAKHWKYISSYHGQWMELPTEVLQSLFAFNNKSHEQSDEDEDRDSDPEDDLPGIRPANKIPPIDPAVFKAVLTVRDLVESASDLAIRAASGTAEPLPGHRNTPMSAVSQSRLRNLAVSKLAQAYRIDEVATAVAVIQGSTALDTLAERVLKWDPSNIDAQYVCFFHERIPSRALAENTNAASMDPLIAQCPTQLAYYRTKAVVLSHQYRFSEAIDTLCHALAVAESQRNSNFAFGGSQPRKSASKGKKGKQIRASGSRAHQNGYDSSRCTDTSARNFGKTPGDDIERHLYFLRGMFYFNWACHILERTVLQLEGAPKPTEGYRNESGEATLDALGIKNTQRSGLLGATRPKCAARRSRYQQALSEPHYRQHLFSLLHESAKDHERFLSYFPISRAPATSALAERREQPQAPQRHENLSAHARRMLQHRTLEGRTRHSHPAGQHSEAEPLVTSYHPLLLEANFTLLLCHLLAGDFHQALKKHYSVAAVMSNLDGFPVFLPARSWSQTQYSELLERLALNWLKDREMSGIPAPECSEEDLHERSSLEALHHLVSFFTPEHGAILAATRKQASDGSKATQSGKAPALPAALSADIPRSSNPDAELAGLTLARAEIGAAWIQTTLLPGSISVAPRTATGSSSSPA